MTSKPSQKKAPTVAMAAKRPKLRAVGKDEFERLWDRLPMSRRRAYPPLEALGYLSLWDGNAFVFVVAEVTEVLNRLELPLWVLEQ